MSAAFLFTFHLGISLILTKEDHVMLLLPGTYTSHSGNTSYIPLPLEEFFNHQSLNPEDMDDVQQISHYETSVDIVDSDNGVVVVYLTPTQDQVLNTIRLLERKLEGALDVRPPPNLTIWHIKTLLQTVTRLQALLEERDQYVDLARREINRLRTGESIQSKDSSDDAQTTPLAGIELQKLRSGSPEVKMAQ
jgi:hypothetical protein